MRTRPTISSVWPPDKSRRPGLLGGSSKHPARPVTLTKPWLVTTLLPAVAAWSIEATYVRQRLTQRYLCGVHDRPPMLIDVARPIVSVVMFNPSWSRHEHHNSIIRTRRIDGQAGTHPAGRNGDGRGRHRSIRRTNFGAAGDCRCA